MPSFLYVISVLLLGFVLQVETTYNVFTYDAGIGDEEHCCLVRIGEKFCMAKPITSSLIQVKKECQRLHPKDKEKNYMDKIIRQLGVEKTRTIDDRILLELREPLDKTILNNDMVCLGALSNKNINLEKCYVELAYVKPKQNKKKRHHASSETVEEPVDEENQIRRFEVTSPIIVHEGQGLTVTHAYELNLTNYKPKTQQQRQCWSWYRTHTKDICNHPTKNTKSCIPLNEQGDKCLEETIYKKLTDDQQESHAIDAIAQGSKLYCEKSSSIGRNQLLGYHRDSRICFQTNHRISIEYKFTDFYGLSDIKKNKHVLRFISNNTKLTSEFETDCNDKTTLVDIKNALEKAEEEQKEAEPIVVDVSSSTEE